MHKGTAACVNGSAGGTGVVAVEIDFGKGRLGGVSYVYRAAAHGCVSVNQSHIGKRGADGAAGRNVENAVVSLRVNNCGFRRRLFGKVVKPAGGQVDCVVDVYVPFLVKTVGNINGVVEGSLTDGVGDGAAGGVDLGAVVVGIAAAGGYVAGSHGRSGGHGVGNEVEYGRIKRRFSPDDGIVGQTGRGKGGYGDAHLNVGAGPHAQRHGERFDGQNFSPAAGVGLDGDEEGVGSVAQVGDAMGEGDGFAGQEGVGIVGGEGDAGVGGDDGADDDNFLQGG